MEPFTFLSGPVSGRLNFSSPSIDFSCFHVILILTVARDVMLEFKAASQILTF